MFLGYQLSGHVGADKLEEAACSLALALVWHEGRPGMVERERGISGGLAFLCIL